MRTLPLVLLLVAGCGSPGLTATTDGATGPTSDLGTGGGLCGTLAPPTTNACCTSCSSSGSCQSNGCYGGWWCDTATCKCKSAPSGCSASSGGDMAGPGATFDAGEPPTGSVGPTGGKVSKLYFAVVGDTRPPNPDDTAHYPSAIIDKIYADIEAMNPRPEFVVTTGDYQFTSTGGDQQPVQIGLYMTAQKQFTGPVFAAMGNHECTGATASNCAGAPTRNMQAYLDAMVTPLGQSQPYYTIPVDDTNGGWTAKLIVTACNAWDAAQYAWLQGELAKPTTYTFVVRHEPKGTAGAPCVAQMDALLAQSKYDLFIVGHSHEYRREGSDEVVIGNGGAPMASSGGGFGYGVVEQTGAGFTVTQFEYASGAPVASFTVP